MSVYLLLVLFHWKMLINIPPNAKVKALKKKMSVQTIYFRGDPRRTNDDMRKAKQRIEKAKEEPLIRSCEQLSSIILYT